MNKSFRQALSGFLLMAAVPLIPVFASFTVPHPAASACTSADCRAFAMDANPFHIPAAAALPRGIRSMRHNQPTIGQRLQMILPVLAGLFEHRVSDFFEKFFVAGHEKPVVSRRFQPTAVFVKVRLRPAVVQNREVFTGNVRDETTVLVGDDDREDDEVAR